MENRNVYFDFSVQWKSLKIERDYLKDLDLEGLKSILNGSIYIFFKPNRDYIRIKGGLIDYLIQFDSVLREIDSGNHNPFSVSSDFYSNSFEYQYDPLSNELRITESNDEEFDILTNYTDFKTSYLKFREDTLIDLTSIQPNLKINTYFKNWMEKKGE